MNEKEHRYPRPSRSIEFLDLEPYRDKLISGLHYGVRKSHRTGAAGALLHGGRN